MITRQSQPMEEAAKVLTLETVIRCNKTPSINHFGMKVLDILAVNEPEKLKEMESKHVTKLMMDVIGLQNKICDVLTSYEGIQQLQNGLTEMELLQMHGIEITL